jgi:uncharacterized protein (DUF2062 family)
MLFSRKNREPIASRLRSLIWPQRGLSRAGLYVWHRLKRLKNRPHEVALGVAIGVFVSFTPFLGLHLALCVVLCMSLRASVMAALIGQVFGNPVTLPFIYLAAWQTGGWVMGADVTSLTLTSLNWTAMLAGWQQLLLPLCVGGLLLGLPTAALSYMGIRLMMPRVKARLARRAT